MFLYNYARTRYINVNRHCYMFLHKFLHKIHNMTPYIQNDIPSALHLLPS
ncbi:MAG: hypothetical protein IKJ97_07240 [Bacteroidaceae bacterium]|nr:hypothetical protein [Bacteroidaceae bacterium]